MCLTFELDQFIFLKFTKLQYHLLMSQIVLKNFDKWNGIFSSECAKYSSKQFFHKYSNIIVVVHVRFISNHLNYFSLHPIGSSKS